jgi:hypothetical protein
VVQRSRDGHGDDPLLGLKGQNRLK